jgi:hypothetical protein
MTKSRSSAVLEKRQAKYESRPVDECAAAAAAGRLIEVSSDLSTPPTGRHWAKLGRLPTMMRTGRDG